MLRLGKYVGRQYFGLQTTAEGSRQRLDERYSERLRRTERGRRTLAGGHVVAGDETALPVAINQQRLMQFKAMVLPYRQMYLHRASPNPEFHRPIQKARS